MGVSLRVSPAGKELLVPYGRGPVTHDGEYVTWRESANCRGADGDIFMVGSNYHSRSHMKAALAFCDACPVTNECLEDAIPHGDHLNSVRGGMVPSDHDRPERKRIKLTPYGDEMWEMYCANLPAASLREASGLSQGSHNMLMTNLLNERLQGPEDASWGAHRAPNNKGIPANSGYLISATPDLYCVIVTNSTGQRQRVVRHASYVTLAPHVTVGNLPLLTRWPTAYDPA